MSRRKQQYGKQLALGSVLAAAAGYLAGVLTAPKSGKETRRDIKDATDRERAQAEKDLKRMHTELDRRIKEARTGSAKLSIKAQEELNEAVERAKDTKEKAREVLSAIHEGDAEDKDLARAVKNADTALKHLRKYLKK